VVRDGDTTQRFVGIQTKQALVKTVAGYRRSDALRISL
jgi:hypothetical protein